jgi:hypothetical protein
VESVDLRDNHIEDVPYVIEELQSTMPNLKDLKINLYEEDHVDFIMRIMPQLQFLNGLPVERDDDEDEAKGVADSEDKNTGAPSRRVREDA